MLEEVRVLRNTLGVIQSLYNYSEASPKRHAFFEDFSNEDDKNNESLLKSDFVTWWSCRCEAVKAVYGYNQLSLAAV